MNYVENAWYVAGWSSDFADKPVRVTILERNIVVFRKADGGVAALADLCPHKLLPLSLGRVVGDDIQCGYHGTVFDARGHCVRVPGQAIIPKRQCVQPYPVHEAHGVVWIWIGDATLADTDQVFDLPQFHDAAWKPHYGDALHIESNYLNVAENLVDPAHVSFVHPTTLGNPESEDVPVQVDTDGEQIVAWRWIRDAPPIGFFRELGGFKGHVDRWHYYYLHLPSTAVIDFGSADSDLQLQEQDREQGMRIFALHFLTPVSATHTIDRWMHLRNRATDDDAVGDKMNSLFRIAFDEDKEVLEAIQIEETRLGSNTAEVPLRLGIDKGPNEYRKRIDTLLAKEVRA
jgi:vanillate O-demethylase monooxygenase subunit